MANLNAANIANMESVPVVKANASDVHGRVRVFRDTYTAAAAAINDTITIARLPTGAKVQDVVVHHAALGTGVILACGDSGDVDRYITAVSSATAGKKVLTAIAGFGFEQTAVTDVILTVTGAAATGLISTAVLYTLD